MSISSVGGAQGTGVSQYLAALLSRIESNSETTSTTASQQTGTGTADTGDAATGTQTQTLSDQVIGALVLLQLQNGASQTDEPQTGASQTDPISQAFSGLDTDGDGTISQSELESAIENAGGTADQADAVFTALGGTDSSGISESAFQQAAQAGRPEHGHHRHDGGQDSAQGLPPGQQGTDASAIFSALDQNQDGSVSASELTAALSGGSDTASSADATGAASQSAASSGSSTSSDSLFPAIDSNGDGSITTDELATYLDNLKQQIAGDQTKLSNFAQLAGQSYNTALGLYASDYGIQGTLA